MDAAASSPEPHTSPMEAAESALPHRWYERLPAALYATCIGMFAIVTAQETLIPIESTVRSIGGVALSLAMSLADHASTKDVFRATDEARTYGIETGYTETNKIISGEHTLESYKKGSSKPIVIATELSYSVLSFLSWHVALPVAATRAVAVLNNRRKAKRVRVAIDSQSE